MKEGYFKKIDCYVFDYRGKRGKPFCLKCKRPLAVVKKENLKRHYETNHPEFKKLDGELRKIKMEEFKKNLYAQQSVKIPFAVQMTMCSQ